MEKNGLKSSFIFCIISVLFSGYIGNKQKQEKSAKQQNLILNIRVRKYKNCENRKT